MLLMPWSKCNKQMQVICKLLSTVYNYFASAIILISLQSCFLAWCGTVSYISLTYPGLLLCLTFSHLFDCYVSISCLIILHEVHHPQVHGTGCEIRKTFHPCCSCWAHQNQYLWPLLDIMVTMTNGVSLACDIINSGSGVTNLKDLLPCLCVTHFKGPFDLFSNCCWCQYDHCWTSMWGW